MSKQMLVVTVLFLCFFTILAVTTISVFRLVYMRSSGTSAASVAGVGQEVDVAKGSYVGGVTMDVQHLARDYYFRLTITGFNGTGIPVVIGGLDGSIRYRDLVNGQSVDRGLLPAPSIETGASYNLTPGPYSEFRIVLEQRVPSALAKQMSSFLSAKGTVQLDLSSLNVWVAQQTRPQGKRRLPIWDGISCQERDGMTFVGKVINMSVTVGTKASDH